MISYSTLAAEIVRAYPEGGTPTVISVRSVTSYEVDFQSLDFLVVEDVVAFDRAALGMIHALGSASCSELRGYLGLGREVSAATMGRLEEEQLVERVGPDEAARYSTGAHFVDPPGDGDDLYYRLSTRGVEVLKLGRRERVKQQQVRIALWAEPLHFLQVCGKGRFAPANTGRLLQAEQVPQILHTIDEVLALTPEQRTAAIGIGEKLPSHQGVLLGCTDGSRWEVRAMEHEGISLLIVAAYPSAAGTRWVSFANAGKKLKRCQRLDGRLLLPEPLNAEDAAWILASQLDLSVAEPAVTRGALRVAANAEDIASLIGERAIPTDVWKECPQDVAGWRTALLLRAIPRDTAAAHVALVELLARRQSELEKNLEGTVAATWTILEAYWEERQLPRPTLEWLLDVLWAHHALRHVVCRERLAHDLIAPYAPLAEAAC